MVKIERNSNTITRYGPDKGNIFIVIESRTKYAMVAFDTGETSALPVFTQRKVCTAPHLFKSVITLEWE